MEESHPKRADAEHEILDLIRHRWSPRAFDASRPVERSDLRRLFEAARWAPSSFNEQPWRFVVAERHAQPDAFAALFDSLSVSNRAWAGAAPVLVLVALRITLERDESVNPHAWYDAGQAVAFLTLQATAMRLSVRQMQGFDRVRARAACAVPEPFEPAVVMAIGQAGDPGTLTNERHRTAEQTPRKRRPIGDFVFEAAWNVPLV